MRSSDMVGGPGAGVQRMSVGLKPYVKPSLVFFGEVRDLTMGGGSVTTEGASPGNTNKCAQNAGIPCAISDRSVKHRIERVGEHPLGFGLFLFDYKPQYQQVFGAGRQFGVMADEVEAVVPEAVRTHSLGIKMVDYAMLGIDRTVH